MKLDSDELARRLRQVQQLESHLSFRLTRLSKYLEQHGQKLLEGSGLHLTSYRMLLIIDIFEEITLSELSQVMVIDAAQVSRAAKELVAREQLEYRAVPGNKRKKFLALTPSGQAVLAEFKPLFDTRDKDIHHALLRADASRMDSGIAAIEELLTTD